VKPTLLTITTVHWPDDTRIRERLIRTLAETFEVRYASREPGPTDTSDLRWVPLRGGRLRRNLNALRHSLFSDWDVLVVHDPELLPAAMLARLSRRRPVVFDVHENIPATALTRTWIPDRLRRPLARVLALLLRLAEKRLAITLAEEGYSSLFKGDHVVFPNYPDTSRYPEPAIGDGSVVYLGDVTIERGAGVAVDAAGRHDRNIVFVGRVTDDLETWLRDKSTDPSRLEFTGLLPNPEAMERIRMAGVGIAPLLDAPNYRHSLPTKVLEYLAVGLPVVASDLPGTRRLVEGLDAIELVPPGDAESLARGIDASLDPTVRTAAATQVEMVRERYRWPGEAVTNFYRSLI
jgi:glycosyltransferase involved in cell wall biosynthesis